MKIAAYNDRVGRSEWGLGFYISNKLLDNAKAVSLQNQ